MTIANVTGGVLFFYGIEGRGLTVQAKDLMTTFDLADTGSFSVPSGPHKAGDIINISGNIAGGQTLRFGPVYYKGTSYPKLWYEGSLEFRAAPITVPRDSSQPVAVHTRFTLEGTLKAYKSNNISGGGGPAVFDVALTGRGKTTAYFDASHDAGLHKLVRDVRAWFYSFTKR